MNDGKHLRTDGWTIKSCDFVEMPDLSSSFLSNSGRILGNWVNFIVKSAIIQYEFSSNIFFCVSKFRISIEKMFFSLKIIQQNLNFSFGSSAYKSRSLYSLISCWRDCLRGRNCCFFFVSSGANSLYGDIWRNRWNSKNRSNSVCVCAIWSGVWYIQHNDIDIVGVGKKEVTQYNVPF